jgi:hypothetical protein
MIHFATFADGDWGVRKAGIRLIKQAAKSDLFSSSLLYSLNDLDHFEPNFSKKHQDFIKRYPRGFGLCFWKPTYLLAALSLCGEDEILVSLDAGCQLNLNVESLKRFHEYIAMAMKSDGLFMQLTNGQFGISDLTDYAWCSSVLIEELKPPIESLETNQVQAGILIIRNSAKVRKLLQKWKWYCEEDNYRFIVGDDSASQTRWEQSIFSLLIKQEDFTLIPDETYWFPNWSNGWMYPIWAMRNRSGGNAYRRNAVDLSKILLARFNRIIQN